MNYKIITVNTLIAFLAWRFFVYVHYVLNIITPNSFNFDFAAPWASLASWREPQLVIIFIILVSLISLSLALFIKKSWALVTAGSVSLVFLMITGFHYINFIGVAVTSLLFLYARNDSVEEISQRIKINPRMIVRRGATAIVMSLFVLISFVAFQSPVAKGIAEAGQLPSASQQLMRSIIDSALGSQIPAGPQKESILTQVTSQTFHQINSMLKPYFQYAPPLLAFGLFLVLWGFSWVFIQLSVLAGIGIFWIMRKTGFVKIEEANVKSEILIV